MRTFELIWENRQPDDDLFPEGLDWDETLVFHGTCSTREAAIDAAGLRPHAAGVPRETVETLVECYGLLGWFGTSPSGVSRLESYTLRNDFRDGDVSPIYLTEQVSQAVCFAIPSAAGGEKRSTVLRAAIDLRRLLDDSEFRSAALRTPDQWASGMAPPALAPALLDRVRQSLDLIGHDVEAARREFSEYRYGVIYAIRPPPSVRTAWEDCKGMGLRVFEPIPLDWICGKLRVHPPPRAH